MTNNIRSRTDSLTPPYPSFGEFIRGLLEEGFTAKDLADTIRLGKKGTISEEAVNRWTSDNPPGKNLIPEILRELGYDFGERYFYEAAVATNFPGASLPDILKDIRTNVALREYLRSLEKSGVAKTSMVAFFHLQTGSVLDMYCTTGANVSEETLEMILRRLPELPLHVDGTILSPITPAWIVNKTALDCRLASGMERKEYADRLGISHEYLRYLESNTEQPVHVTNKGGGIGKTNPDRWVALCARLTEERVRLGLVKDDHPAAPTPRAIPEQVKTEKEDPPPPDLVWDTSDPLENRFHAIERRLAELEREVRAGRKMADEQPPSDNYRSPFSPERWQEHDAAIDDVHVGLIRTLIIQLCEELGRCAQMRDPQKREVIRKQLSEPLMIELLGAVEGFLQEHPSGALQIIQSWRQFHQLTGQSTSTTRKE